LVGPGKQIDIDRYKFYASFVKVIKSPLRLNLRAYGLLDIDPRSFQHLGVLLGSPIFPQLNTLLLPYLGPFVDWQDRDMILQDITPLVSSGRLQKVDLNLIDHDSHYVSQLLPFSQEIRILSLSGYISSSAILASVKFPRLQNFSVDFDLQYAASPRDQDHINQSVSCLFQSLSSLPRLVRLRLELPNWTILPIIPPNMFANVTALTLVGSATIVSQVLSSAALEESPDSIPFRHILLGFTDEQFNENVLANRQSSIRNLVVFASLSCLTLTIVDGSSLKAFIDPILGLPLMRSLIVKCKRRLAACADLDDLDVQRIVRAWPLLECLALYPCVQDHTNGIISKISLSGVQSLARLKHLRVLSIRVGRREVVLPRGYYHSCESPFDSYVDTLFTFSQLNSPFFPDANCYSCSLDPV